MKHLPMIPLSKRFATVAASKEVSDEFLASDFLQGLTTGLHDWESQYRRQLTRALAVALVFVTLAEASVAEISIGGIALTDLSLPLKVLPVLFAYTLVESLVARMGAQIWRRVWSSTIDRLQPQLCQEHLELFMLPAQPYVLSEVVRHSADSQTSAMKRRVGASIDAFFYIATMVLPVVFLSYCYLRLFQAYGCDSIATWISLVLTVILTVEAALILLVGLDVD